MSNYKKLQETIKFIEIYGFQMDFQGCLTVPQVPALAGISPLQMISELDALSSIYTHFQTLVIICMYMKKTLSALKQQKRNMF